MQFLETILTYSISKYLLITSMMLFTGCLDIIEPDLDQEKIEVLGPKNNFNSEQQSVTFWWEEINLEAISYEIEIVQPNFANAERLVVQEEITETKTTQTLLPGNYQWRIHAIRHSQKISSENFNLQITLDSTSDLSNQILTLVQPINNLITNQTSIDFLWQELADAEDYYIQIATPDFSNSTYIVADLRSQDDFLFLDNLSEGNYRWRIRAENQNSVTPFSTQDFEIDLTPPIAPTILLPAQGDTLTLPSMLSWNSAIDATQDSLKIYQDSLLQSPALIIGTNMQFYSLQSLPANNYYFWQIKSIDLAGNQSEPSAIGKFFVE